MFAVMSDLLEKSNTYDDIQVVERRAHGASSDVKSIHYETVPSALN